MKDMWIAVALTATVLFTVGWLAIRAAQEESRRWRRLIQLYLEKQVHAPLPIDEDPDAPAESVLSLPDEEMDEIERQVREEEEALLRVRQ